MAREFKFEVLRGDNTKATLYVHNDGTLELVDPDSGEDINYLSNKLTILNNLISWSRRYNVHKIKLSDNV